MSYLASVKRSAVVSWCPFSHKSSYFASATSACGAGDGFDNSSFLELYEFNSNNQDLNPKVKVELSDRVHSLAWGSAGQSNGIIAAGLPSGCISFIDGAKVLGEESNFETETIAVPSKHVNPVYSVNFNPLQPPIMASGSDNSEVFIWNLAKPESPVAYAPGNIPNNTDNISDLQWNCVVPYILGTVTQSAKIVIWDLRNKRPAVQFTDRSGKLKSCKSISWNPKNSMQLITASEDDNSPIIQVWNLRNTQMPTATLQGHTRGVWSTSWCPHDSKYVLSTGRENKAFCWNLEDNSLVDEIPIQSDCNSSIQWNPNLEAVFSVSSFNDQISIYSIHDVKGKQTGDNTFNRAHPPSWLKRPAGAVFGFGGKLAKVDGSNINITAVVSNPEIIDCAASIESIIQSDDHKEYCNNRVQNADSEEEKDIWSFILSQFADNKRDAILEQIGFNKEDAKKAVLSVKQVEEKHEDILEITLEDDFSNDDKIEEEPTTKEEDVSDLFGGSSDVNDPFSEGNMDVSDPFSSFAVHADDPFAQDSSEWDNFHSHTNNDNNENENNTSNIIEMASKIEKPFTFLKNASNNDSILIRNIMLHNFEEAIECCFRLNRPADALLIALNSNDNLLLAKTQEKYVNSLPRDSPMHFTTKLSSDKLRDIIAQADINEWRCTLAVLCSYSNDNDFPSLCADLGDLLIHCGEFKAANLCYICAGNIDSAVLLWDKQVEGKNRLEHIYSVMEKICILRSALNSNNVGVQIVKKYCEFAELLASQGELEQAYKFISFLNDDQYSSINETSILNRISSSLNEEEQKISVKPIVYNEPVVNNNNPSKNTNIIDSSNNNSTQKNPMTNVYNPNIYQQNPVVSPMPVTPMNPPIQPVVPIQPIFNPVQPVKPVVPPMPVTSQPVTNNSSFGQPMPVNPIQPVKPVVPPMPAIPKPVTNNTFGQQRISAPSLPAYDNTPKQESLPDAVINTPVEQPVVVGKVEVADNLANAIETVKQSQANNPAVLSLIKGCNNDRITTLRTKLQKNELSNETVEVLERFIEDFKAQNKAGVEQGFQWLTKNKYTEVTAKIMLGLKKLHQATQKIN